jgi:hypothetical protein
LYKRKVNIKYILILLYYIALNSLLSIVVK